MPITVDLADPIGQVRIEIGDDIENLGVLPEQANVADATITYFYEQEGSHVGRGSARVAEYVADKWRSVPSSWRIGREQEVSDAVARWETRARQLRQLHGHEQTIANPRGGTSTVTSSPYGGLG